MRKMHARIYLTALTMVFIIMSCPAISSAGLGISRLTTQVTQTNESAFRYETGVTEYPWAQHCHDAQRTGFTQSPAPVSNHTLWKFSGDGKDFYISFPTVANGKVFLAVQVPLPYDHIYALDANTGEQIWSWRPEGLPIGSGFQAAPVVDAGKLYFPTGTSLYCISEAGGDVMWKYDFGHSLGGTHSVAVSGGRIYGFSMNSVWCIETGYMTGYFPVLKWETLSGGNFTIDPQYSGLIGSPAVGEGKVIGIGRGSGDVFCLNATTGQWKWTVHTGGITQYTPTIYGGKVYYGNNNGDLYCWNADTGQEIWKKHFSLGICWSPAVAYDNVYAGSYDGWFRAFNANTGALVWEIDNTAAQASHPFLGYWGVWHAPPAVADHRVYMGGHDGYFYCWNASTGQELWKYKVGGDVCAGPAIADGRAYVGSHYIFSKLEGQGTGTFYCFGKGPTTTKVSTMASTVTNGTSMAILGTVTDESSAHLGEAVEGVQVKLTYQTDGDWTDLATVTTSSTGDFSYEWAPSELGTYKIMAYFEGDKDYEWSASEATFQVTSAPPLPEFPEYGTSDFPAYPVYPEYTTVDLFIMVAVIVAIVIGLYNTYTLRKK
jgi:outer membrane protein assembly factor BamB